MEKRIFVVHDNHVRRPWFEIEPAGPQLKEDEVKKIRSTLCCKVALDSQ